MNESFSIHNNAIFREKEKLILFFLSIKNTVWKRSLNVYSASRSFFLSLLYLH